MRVFLSWSGAPSRAIAQALREWLPLVIQAVEPWMSDVDIGKGTRWAQEIGVELAQTSFGIICLTPDNLDAPWINFEAGAISKTLDGARVCTYLYNLKPTDVEGPLSQFNHTRVDKEETHALLHAINQALGTQSLKDQVLDRLFDALWPQFEEKLSDLPPLESSQRPDRPLKDMIEELLELVRTQTTMSLSSTPANVDDASEKGRIIEEEICSLLTKETQPLAALEIAVRIKRSRPDTTRALRKLQDAALIRQDFTEDGMPVYIAL